MLAAVASDKLAPAAFVACRLAHRRRNQGNKQTMKFPSDWPPDCPPDDGVDAHGDVFRIVDNDPPGPVDLASHFETGKLRKAPACLRCGLSVFREIRDAIHQRLLLPKLGRWIAKGTLIAEHGKTKLTEGRQPTHTPWWAYDGVERAALFATVQQDV